MSCKSTSLSLAVVLAGIHATVAADQMDQPTLIEPAAFQYEQYYSSEIEVSPSDVPPAPYPEPPDSEEPVEAIQEAADPAPLTSTPLVDSGWGDPGCTPRCACDCCGDAWMEFGGWTQLGFHTNETPLSRPGNTGRSFNDLPNRLNLHQQWLWAERVADGSRGLDFGFRLDATYGTDAQKTQAFGNPGAANPGIGTYDASLDHGAYGWALPQLYAEVAYGDWSVIAGHFYTLVGYEVVTAPDNFFYSHSLTMFNSEPFTHTGLLATYSGLQNTTLYGGWTLGWDTGFDQDNGGSTFLGGFSTDLTDDVTLTYISTIGNFGQRSGGGSGYSHSIVLDVALTCHLNYVLQSDLVAYNDQTGTGLNDDQVGINQYLFYSLSDTTDLGARFEWWKTDGISFYEMTYGLNYRLADNMVLRPELRYDWTPTAGAYVDGSSNATTFGMDWIMTY